MERTKTVIVEAFQQALEETPINKIAVKSIVERCGVNRNTFYYYFEGIPELVEYHLTVMTDQLLGGLEQPSPTEELHRIVNYFDQRRKSVLHVYRYYPKEQFLLLLNKVALNTIEKSLKQRTEEAPISEEDMTVLTRFYKGALVGGLLDWLDAGMSYDMSAMVTRLGELMEGSTRQAIEKCRVKP